MGDGGWIVSMKNQCRAAAIHVRTADREKEKETRREN
jgi:hypothetical protein